MANRMDPYHGYNFAVELDGITRAGFRECSGLDSTQSVTTYREGTDRNLAQRKLGGLTTYADITLGRGLTADNRLWDWRQKAARGTIERHNVSISLLDELGNARITWNLFDAWPTHWAGPSFNATGEEIAVESLTLAYERLEVDQWK